MIDIARVNTSIAGLLNTHRQALQVKQIHDERALRKILCCDFEKVLHALVDAQSIRVDQLLCEAFFAEQPAIVQAILGHVTDHRLNHVGFEIFEPLDLVLQGIDYWVDNLNKDLGQRIKVNKFLRFPASQSFQRRVNAFVEIMCIWLQVDGEVFVLELFDISHPLKTVPHADSGTIYHLSPHALLTNGWVSRQHRQAMKHLFQGDTIWHYSIHVSTRQAVQQLHEKFQALTAEEPQYRLAYAAPVENKHDGSFHTKVINLINGLELEFCNLSPVQNTQPASRQPMLAIVDSRNP